MDVILKQLETIDEALDLAPEIDRYAEQVIGELRDAPPPPGTGERLLRRVMEAPEGLVLVAHAKDGGQRIGMCVTAPLVDPLVGDSSPMIVVLEVDPDHRHRGLAGQLVRAARDTLGKRGLNDLGARAGHNDDALISMGERWGFVRVWEFMVREEE
jgi:GNAT superfamily N-acetyltransferase